MAIRNSYSVYIDGVSYTNKAVMPLKWGDFLDERLDECYLNLRSVKVKVFHPLTPVEIRLSNKLYFHSEEKGEETIEDKDLRIKQYLVADDNSTENPIGSGKYDHQLYLIETTKYAECIVVDTLTYTNDIGRIYTNNAKAVTPEETEG